MILIPISPLPLPNSQRPAIVHSMPRHFSDKLYIGDDNCIKGCYETHGRLHAAKFRVGCQYTLEFNKNDFNNFNLARSQFLFRKVPHHKFKGHQNSKFFLEEMVDLANMNVLYIVI